MDVNLVKAASNPVASLLAAAGQGFYEFHVPGSGPAKSVLQKALTLWRGLEKPLAEAVKLSDQVIRDTDTPLVKTMQEFQKRLETQMEPHANKFIKDCAVKFDSFKDALDFVASSLSLELQSPYCVAKLTYTLRTLSTTDCAELEKTEFRALAEPLQKHLATYFKFLKLDLDFLTTVGNEKALVIEKFSNGFEKCLKTWFGNCRDIIECQKKTLAKFR